MRRRSRPKGRGSNAGGWGCRNQSNTRNELKAYAWGGLLLRHHEYQSTGNAHANTEAHMREAARSRAIDAQKQGSRETGADRFARRIFRSGSGTEYVI